MINAAEFIRRWLDVACSLNNRPARVCKNRYSAQILFATQDEANQVPSTPGSTQSERRSSILVLVFPLVLSGGEERAARLERGWR